MPISVNKALLNEIDPDFAVKCSYYPNWNVNWFDKNTFELYSDKRMKEIMKLGKKLEKIDYPYLYYQLSKACDELEDFKSKIISIIDKCRKFINKQITLESQEFL